MTEIINVVYQTRYSHLYLESNTSPKVTNTSNPTLNMVESYKSGNPTPQPVQLECRVTQTLQTQGLVTHEKSRSIISYLDTDMEAFVNPFFRSIISHIKKPHINLSINLDFILTLMNRSKIINEEMSNSLI